MGRNMTSGRSGAPGAYTKPSAPTAHAGAVYTVCGVSGKRDPQGALNHPAMFLSTYAHHGSMVLDIEGDSMHVQFINEAGTVVGHFDMVKPPTSVNRAREGDAARSIHRKHRYDERCAALHLGLPPCATP